LAAISLSKHAYSRMIGEVLLENLGSIVGRSIIDHHYLFRNTRLCKDAVDRFDDEATVVIRTYDHGHSHISPNKAIQWKLARNSKTKLRSCLRLHAVRASLSA
jgi:hypothetical protein